MKFKKIMTVLASAALVGTSMAAASAASYPSQLTSGGVNVVVGTDGAEASDMSAATAIEADLQEAVDASSIAGASTVDGGESFMLDKSSDHFNFNDNLNGVSGYDTLTKDEMTFLADGTYDDGDIDEDYEEVITLKAEPLTLFADNKYMDDEPTIGFWFDNKEEVLDYTITFDSAINMTDMVGTDMPLLGGEYYVLSVDTTNSKITLLDSADTTILAEGESITVNGKSVSIDFIDSDEVRLNVDGEVTDSMGEGDTEELDDGTYVAVVDLTVQDYAEGVKKVEFSIGDGKIILETGKDIIFGEDSDDEIDELTATVTNTVDQLTAISVEWASKDDTFLAEGGVITMPGFGAVSVEFAGLNFPSDSETIEVENGDTLNLVMGNFEIPLMWMNSSGYQALGEEDYPLKAQAAATATTFAAAGFTNGSTTFWGETVVNTSTLSTGLAVQEDDRFIVTMLDTDLSDIEQLYYEVSDLEVDGDTVTLELTDLIGDDDLSYDDVDDTDDHGDITVTLDGFDATANTTAYLSFSGGSVSYNTVVSELGMVVTLPTSAAEGQTLTFREADEDNDINEGTLTTATVANSSDDKLYVTYAAGNATEVETTNDNSYYAILNSVLASKVMTNEPTGDDSEYDFEIEYFGEEVTAEVNVVAGGDVVDGDAIDVKVLTDAEAATATGNLVVVGGNCVNAIARDLLGLTGGDGCMEAFPAGDGDFLIKSFARGDDVALLVAGYSAADTTKAKNALIAADDLDVSVGMAYKAESTTTADATLVAA